jgi:HAD superfamily hydrolase (TIGR01450 family)
VSIAPIHIRELVARHSVLLLDAYGVLIHADGVVAGASKLIDHLNRTKKPYFVLTNDASRLPATASARYASVGLEIEAARIIPSGALLGPHFERHGLRGSSVAVLGTEDSKEYVRRAGGVLVAPGEDAQVVVVADESGYPFLETVDATLSAILRRLAKKEPIRLLLPNPDLIYPAGEGKSGIAAGSIALMFEAAIQLVSGGTGPRFQRLGKPHSAIFEEAARRAGTRDLVMIGDQLETDVRGARAFGIHAALVETGLVRWSELAATATVQPDYLLSSLEV